jgi:hypothetical protein
MVGNGKSARVKLGSIGYSPSGREPMQAPMFPMSQLRRVAMFLVTIVLTAVPVVIGASAPAGAATGDITLTTSTLPAMHAGQTAWVSTLWNGTNKAADNFKLTATSTGATISYPANTATYSSLYGSSTLSNNATDFAALKVRINDAATSSVTIDLSAEYDLRNNNGNNSNPTHMTQSKTVTIPITAVTGSSLTVNTTSLTSVAHGGEAWQKVSVTGKKPGVTNLTATVSAPAGITVAYPADGSAAGPSQSSTLDVDTTDFLAFKTAADSSVVPGTYNVTVTMSFGNGQQQQATVSLVVT